ncbi:putative sodium/potassium/calcium exchanger [Halorussus ruber]|uniref:hypothetical protein n=1 Tax=Halorussus ruber TaxID=1126238 RepID=UPI001092E434|nr:hypothetical protein [Halorussus ruber]
MRPTFVFLLAAVALVGATGAAAADGGQHPMGGEGQSPNGADQRTSGADQFWGQEQSHEQNQSNGENESAAQDRSSEQNRSNDESNSTERNQSEAQSQPEAQSESTEGNESAAQNRSAEQNRSSERNRSNEELGIQAETTRERPDRPGEDTATENNSTTTGVSPGQQLAGAVGAQGASLQGELWNRTLSERLNNATTSAQRAAVVADEVESLESYLDALSSVRENITERRADDEISEGQYRASLSEFVVRARTVELRANQTARAAERLPTAVRIANDINVTHIRNLSAQAHDLYQFEDEIGREVANETLANQSTEELPMGDESEDSEKDEDEKRSDER